MREILFRGKTPKTNYWVVGQLLHWANYSQIWEKTDSCTANYNVMADTVGQYTGCKDKDGVKIFEGDLVEWDGNSMDTYVIEYSDDGCFYGVPVNGKLEKVNGASITLNNSRDGIVVVGNIHDCAQGRK